HLPLQRRSLLPCNQTGHYETRPLTARPLFFLPAPRQAFVQAQRTPQENPQGLSVMLVAAVGHHLLPQPWLAQTPTIQRQLQTAQLPRLRAEGSSVSPSYGATSLQLT